MAEQASTDTCPICGSEATVTGTDSAWEFNSRCNNCGTRRTISWAHRADPPIFHGDVQPSLFPKDDQ